MKKNEKVIINLLDTPIPKYSRNVVVSGIKSSKSKIQPKRFKTNKICSSAANSKTENKTDLCLYQDLVHIQSQLLRKLKN